MGTSEATGSSLRRLLTPVGLVALVVMSAASGAFAAQALSNTASAAPLFDEDSVSALYDRAIPAVIEVDVALGQMEGSRRFHPSGGQGSGFLIDGEKGYILTNNHVIEGASRVRVVLKDARTIDAEIVGSSPSDDVALLKVDPSAVQGVAPLVLGDSATVKPGQMAIALGSPYGLQESITVGVVSGVNRSRPGGRGRTITGMIQTDALLNPGNSGGPLLNSRGEVIGINTSVESSLAGNSGIGFAIPIDTVKSLLTQLELGQEVSRPWLGVQGTTVGPELVDLLDLPVQQGVYVLAVQDGSPAEAAGLQGGRFLGGELPETPGDVITALDGRAVRSIEGLITVLNGHKPGDSVQLSVRRGQETLEITVVLGKWPEPVAVH